MSSFTGTANHWLLGLIVISSVPELQRISSLIYRLHLEGSKKGIRVQTGIKKGTTGVLLTFVPIVFQLYNYNNKS